MATTRKRTSGFTEKKVEITSEVAEISELLDAVAAEMFETISRTEEEAEEKIEEVAPPAAAPAPVHVFQTLDPPPAVAPPKRHRRNVPRFSNSN